VPLLAGGVGGLVVLLVAAAWRSGGAELAAACAIAVLGALVVISAGVTYARRPVSPYLARAADIVDTLMVISVVPIACAVLGLYAKVRGLAG
jgi:EccD-like transmembrane domain